MERIEIRSPQTPIEWEKYYDLRYRILRAPLGQERGSEKNEGDASGKHFALFVEDKICAIGRLDSAADNQGQARFVAVEEGFGGKGYGSMLMLKMEEFAKDSGQIGMILQAREGAVEFYKNLDYSLIEKTHLLFGQVQHYLMRKSF